MLTLHNPFRSRDVSHFEKFREFHEKLYYYVEPISITPFSHKSVEKYLPLFIGAYVRHLYPTLADNKSAGNIDMVKIGEIEQWIKKKEESQDLVYIKNRLGRDQQATPLYSSTEDYDEIRQQNKWKVPTALRILEPEAVIHIIK